MGLFIIIIVIMAATVLVAGRYLSWREALNIVAAAKALELTRDGCAYDQAVLIGRKYATSLNDRDLYAAWMDLIADNTDRITTETLLAEAASVRLTLKAKKGVDSAQ